jgi:serine/threonine-protein kinase
LSEESAAPQHARVAPTMSAVREETPVKESRPRRRPAPVDDGDIPKWLRTTLAVLLGMVVMMVAGWVVFNLNKPKQVTIPELKRLTLTEAESRLKALGLRMRVVRRVTSEQFPADTVTSTDPSPGSKVYEGGNVGVVLSTGSRFVEVPDLRGLNLDKAKEMLDSLGLVMDERVAEERDRNVEAGLIVGQIPEPRTKHERGTSVRVRISSGSEPARRDDPSFDRKFLYTVRIKLTGLTEPVVLRVDMTDTRGTKTVHEEMHSPEDEVEITAEGYGGEAVFRIFYDGDLVTQVTKKADQEAEPE